jgi:hypothetical protein
MMTMSLGVRPIRTALLVHVPEELPWEGVMRAAISSQTEFWGGSGSVVIPYDAAVADNEAFWAVLEVFDADRIKFFTPSWGELESIDAERYTEGRTALDHRLGHAAAADLVAQWHAQPYAFPQLSAGLEWLLIDRLAPFHSPGATVQTITGLSPRPFAETSIATVGLPSKKLVDQVAGPPSPVSLYATALLGRYSPGGRELVQGLGATIGDYSVGSAVELLDLYDNRPSNPDVAYPWEASETGLGHYRRVAPHRHPVVVAGDEAWDFALFYALRRMGETVWWCPEAFVNDALFRIRLMLMLDRAATSARLAHVVSGSSPDLAGSVAEKLRKEIFQSRRPIEISHTSWRGVLPDDPSRLYERDGYGLPQAILLQDGATPELPTPIPEVAAGAGPADLHWVTEVRTEGWTPLRNGGLATELLTQHLYDSEHLRTTRDGVAYYCPNYAWAGTPSLETVVARPNLRPWSLLEQVREIAYRDGWKVDPSDKGIYASESAALFGGFRDLDDALRDGPTRAIFDAYVCGDALGLFLKSDRRRYLDIVELRVLAKGAPDADGLIGSLLEKGVLIRGYPLKCSQCRQVSWYTLDDVGTTFRCARCRLVQEVGAAGFLTGIEPVLRYRLSEVVYQMLEHDGDLPLRAAARLTEGSMRPPDYCFELEFVSQTGAKAEHDIVVSDGYRLWVGEATSSDRLAKSSSDQHERLVELKAHAEMLGAYGVVLATTAPAFWDKLRAQAKSPALFGGPWPRLLLIEGLT